MSLRDALNSENFPDEEEECFFIAGRAPHFDANGAGRLAGVSCRSVGKF